MLQFWRPDALPESPLEVLQVTDVIPAPPEAVPLKAIVPEEVLMFVPAGTTMLSAGGPEFPPGGAVGDVAGSPLDA